MMSVNNVTQLFFYSRRQAKYNCLRNIFGAGIHVHVLQIVTLNEI